MFDKYKVNRRLKEVKKLEEEVRRLKGGKTPKETPEKISPEIKRDMKKLDVLNVDGTYITKDLRFRWILVVGIAIAIIIGLTVFSQWKFKDINSEFDAKVAELQKTYDTLKENEGKLNQTAKELTLKTARESSLAEQYEAMKSERDDYKGQKEQLEADNANLQFEIDDLKQENEDLRNENAALKKKLSG